MRAAPERSLMKARLSPVKARMLNAPRDPLVSITVLTRTRRSKWNMATGMNRTTASGTNRRRPVQERSHQELFDYTYKTCANKCVASVKEGKLKGESKCR